WNAAPIDDELDERQKERRVAAGTDLHELVGLLRGLAAARIDDDDFASALADRANAVFHVRSGHRASLRDQRIRADAQEVVRAIDVRHRNDERAPVKIVRSGKARARILRPGAERVA